MKGLTTAEAAERLSRIGPNALPGHAPDLLWRRFAQRLQPRERRFGSPFLVDCHRTSWFPAIPSDSRPAIAFPLTAR